MFYPYCTIGEDLEVGQTPMSKDGFTIVRFEKPDFIYGFKTLDCAVPSYRVSNIIGFSEEEVANLVDFYRHNADLLLLGAETEGGIINAYNI